MIKPPPVELMYDGPSNEFESNGKEYLEIYKRLCQLQPNEKMLDVGSGIGRKTIPLTEYFTNEASYTGIDVHQIGIDWCKHNISSVFQNFKFEYVDVYAPGYNIKGQIDPVYFRFPFLDGSFDFVVLNSVFTHMCLPGIINYLSEVRRVLKTTGRCLISYFLLNEVVENRIAADPKSLGFPYLFGQEGRVADAKFPEQAVALNEHAIKFIYKELGLDIRSVYPGWWSDTLHKENRVTYQDLILAGCVY